MRRGVIQTQKTVCYFSPDKSNLRTGEMALQLRAQAAHPEDLSLIPRTHMKAYNCATLVPEELMPSSGLHLHQA